MRFALSEGEEISGLNIASELRLEIEYVSPTSLVANELNPKQHPERQINALAKNIGEAGFLVPVIIDHKNVIYAGHGRVLAALKVGISTIPAVRLGHLNDHQLRALMLADNRLAELGKVDQQLLAENLKLLTVEGLDLDIEAATSFTMGEIDQILEGANDARQKTKTRTTPPLRLKKVPPSTEPVICGTLGDAAVSSAGARLSQSSGLRSWAARRPA